MFYSFIRHYSADRMLDRKKISLDVEGFCCFFPRKLSNQNRIVDVKFDSL